MRGWEERIEPTFFHKKDKHPPPRADYPQKGAREDEDDSAGIRTPGAEGGAAFAASGRLPVGVLCRRRHLPAGRRAAPVVCRQGADAETAGTLTSCTLILFSAVLTTLGWYQKLAAKAGAGSLVPITGFANAVVSAAIEFKAEGRVTGTGAKMFLIAGPVIVYGTLAAVVYGVVLWLLGASIL